MRFLRDLPELDAQNEGENTWERVDIVAAI